MADKSFVETEDTIRENPVEVTVKGIELGTLWNVIHFNLFVDELDLGEDTEVARRFHDKLHSEFNFGNITPKQVPDSLTLKITEKELIIVGKVLQSTLKRRGKLYLGLYSWKKIFEAYSQAGGEMGDELEKLAVSLTIDDSGKTKSE